MFEEGELGKMELGNIFMLYFYSDIEKELNFIFNLISFLNLKHKLRFLYFEKILKF